MDEALLNKKIENDEEASKILSTFLDTKNISLFNIFLEYYNSHFGGEIVVREEDISKLLYKVNGKSILEYLLDNSSMLHFSFNYYIADNIDTIKECIRLKKYRLLELINVNTLLSEYENGITVFDYFLKNNLLTIEMIKKIWPKQECVYKIINSNPELLLQFGEYDLFEKNIGSIKVIDFLFLNNLVSESIVSRIFLYSEIYDLCIKYNRKDLLPFLSSNVLSEKKDNKYIIEHLIDKDIYPVDNRNFNDINIIRILIKNKLFNYFINNDEGMLLIVLDGKTILEYILENGLTPTRINSFSSEKSIKIFYKYKRFDLINNWRLDDLVELYDLNNTYLDFILDSKYINFNIANVNMRTDSGKNYAKFYIIAAKHGLINHIPSLANEELLKEDAIILKELLTQDSDITINKILNNDNKENIDIAIILKMYGIEQNNIDIDLHSMNMVDDYYNKYNSNHINNRLSQEAIKLLDELKNLMTIDGLSDPKMIENMIISYKNILSINYELGIRELKKIIEIKKKTINFSIKRTMDRSFYLESDNSVNLKNACLSTLNHEMGHAFLHNLTDYKTPSYFTNIIEQLRNDPKVLRNTSRYVKRIEMIKKRVWSMVEVKYMKKYHYSDEEMKDIDGFLSLKHDELKEKYIKKGYDEKTVDIIVSSIYSREEYLKQDRRIKKEEIYNAIMESDYGAFYLIGDILDAIYKGKLHDGELYDQNGQLIPRTFGHGIVYYERDENTRLDEIIANYSAIVKSKDGKRALRYLRVIVGNKFVDFIENYYQSILNSNSYRFEKETTISK